MRAQLKAAGLSTTEDMLVAAADEAVAGGGPMEGAVRQFYAELMLPAWAEMLFARWLTEAARPYLAAAAERRRQAGASRILTSNDKAPPHQSPPAGRNARGAHSSAAGGAGNPSSGLASGATQTWCAARPAARPDDTAGLRRVAHLSMLETFKVNGQAIGKLTPREALSWAGSRERDARFVRLLCANLPPDGTIAAFRTAEDADRLWAAAQEINE